MSEERGKEERTVGRSVPQPPNHEKAKEKEEKRKRTTFTQQKRSSINNKTSIDFNRSKNVAFLTVKRSVHYLVEILCIL